MHTFNTDTNLDNIFYEKWYKPHTKWDVPSKKILKLSDYYSFDLDKLKKQVLEIQNNYGLKPFPIKKNSTKKRMTYRGIGITSRKNSSDPLYDSLHLYNSNGEIDISDSFNQQSINNQNKKVVSLYERNFSEPTEIYTGYLSEILSKFKSPLTKCRFLELCPKGVITPHVDFPYYEQIRIHAVITTNENVFWEVEGEKFQIPADGNFYWFDTGRYHSVYNNGNTSRIVLSVNLSIYKNYNDDDINVDKNIDDILNSENL